MNIQGSSVMQVTHVQKYRGNSRRRRQSPQKIRAISAVTTIGSFEQEIIENTKESNLNNIDSKTLKPNDTSVSPNSKQKKISKPPTTTISVVPVQPSALITNQCPYKQNLMLNNIQKPCCSKIRLEQGSKNSLSSRARVHPDQTTTSPFDFDQINAESLSKNSFLIRNNSDSEKQTISDRFTCNTSENTNGESTYLTEPTNKNRRRRRLCNGFCRCCSPCCCLFVGLLIPLCLAGLATLVTLLTLSKSPTTTTTTTTTSTSTSSSTSSTSTTVTLTTTKTTVATTVTITSNTCTSTWNGVSIFNICINCPNINSYQQYAYSYIAIATQTRITFAFHEDVGYFALDDVSVRNSSAPTIELLTNGGFETGNLSSWVYCNPSGSAYPGIIKSTSDNFVGRGQTYAAHGGNYYYLDGAVGSADYLSQMWQTSIGETYNISFWLYNQGSGSNSDGNVIISI